MTAADRNTATARRILDRKMRGEAIPDAEWMAAMQAVIDGADWVRAQNRRTLQ